MRKPFYRNDRGAWYVRTGVGKSQKRLHENQKEAYKRWQEMQLSAESGSAETPFSFIAAKFLSWVETHNSKETFAWRGRYVTSACNSFGSVRIRDLKPFHVSDWIQTEKGWGSESQRAAISSVKRCLAWANEEGILSINPLAKVKKPSPKRRQWLVSDEDHARMINAAPTFRAILTALKHSGCRPGTIASLRIQDVSDDTWVVHRHKTRGKTGKPLVIYLSPVLQVLTRIAAAGRTEGPLFVNSRGVAWTPNAIRCRMRRLRKDLGLPRGVVAYAYRHTYTTTAIVNGTDLATVAELLGHSDLKMISQHYGHLDKKKEHLRQAAAKALRKQA